MKQFFFLFFIFLSFNNLKSNAISIECNNVVLDDSVAYDMIDTALSIYYSTYGDSVAKFLQVKKMFDYGVVNLYLRDEFDEFFFDLYQFDSSDEERENKRFFWYKGVLVLFYLSDNFEIKKSFPTNCILDTWFRSRILNVKFGLCGEFISIEKCEEFLSR